MTCQLQDAYALVQALEAPLLVRGASLVRPCVKSGTIVGGVVGDVEHGVVADAEEHEVLAVGGTELPLLVAVVGVSLPDVASLTAPVVGVQVHVLGVHRGEEPVAVVLGGAPLLVGASIAVPLGERDTRAGDTATYISAPSL